MQWEKNYIEEITRLLKLWIQDSPFETDALKAIHLMSTLLLQIPSKNSKNHLISLERRLKLWEEGNISNLLHEGKAIQERIKISEKDMSIEKISLKFKNLMRKGNVNGAFKHLTENMPNEILPLTSKTLKM